MKENLNNIMQMSKLILEKLGSLNGLLVNWMKNQQKENSDSW